VRHLESLVSLPASPVAVFQSEGTGLPIVLLHGSGASAQVFSRQFESPLAERHRLVSFDLPGHGRSPDATDPESTYSLAALTALTLSLLDQLEIARALVCGWSLGGHIAIEMMREAPERLAGVMVSGTPPIARGPLAPLRAFQMRPELLLASKEVFTEQDAVRYAALCFGGDADEEHIADVLRADGRMRRIIARSMTGRGPDQKHVVETSPVPLAVVNGAEDPLVRLGYVAGLRYAHLWDGICHIIPDAGHAPFLNAPNAFNLLLLRFAHEMALREARRAADVRKTGTA